MTGTVLLDDRDELALEEIVSGLVDAERVQAELDAQKTVRLAAAMRLALARMQHSPRSTQEREMAVRSIAAEIGVALRWNDRTVQRRMNDALVLTERFPATLDALADGRISARHAAIIRDTGAVFADAPARADFEALVLERACSDTAARTEAFARRVAAEFHPEGPAVRFARAEQTRRVWVEELDDGLGQLGVIDSAVKIRAMHDRLTRQARALHAAHVTDGADAVDDDRTMDQTRADLLCDLVLTGQPAIDPTSDVLPGGLGAIRAHVQLTVPALTAAGAGDRGALLDGVSPIDPDTARALLTSADPAWDRVLTSPVTGSVLAVDRYRPSAAIRRLLIARDVHCRFPGCRQPAHRCQHDHNIDWARGGPTAACNLACLCTRHHTLKTETPWSARQLPDGSIEWTSPSGRCAIDKPERRAVAFVAEPDPPPF